MFGVAVVLCWLRVYNVRARRRFLNATWIQPSEIQREICSLYRKGATFFKERENVHNWVVISILDIMLAGFFL